ncbi:MULTISPECIES: NAD(P)H-dependent flavin oxidoreductase [Acetobacteraceae]|uniref:NAD(P)H-dependent flavin oxidoreductase n=1 Tax=Acetobacteraceae TaxID=433 RepID=UPI000FDF9B5B|nr:nitronate monooxygenase family protein [Komagataeibacter xylinus]AZV40716.1 nitronate monooxygenase [Komagataeibacter xylinus]
MNWPEQLGLTIPLVQAPMAGVSTPALAAAVSQAGALGSIGVGAAGVSVAHKMICQIRQQTAAPFNVNLFAHKAPEIDPARDRAWLTWLKPLFAEFNAVPPARLHPIYRSFNDDPDMLDMLVHMKPPVISFHFGLPSTEKISALKATGAVLLATVTSLEEARAAETAGMDAIVAQGIEAGSHRRIFDPAGHDDALGTLALTRLLVRKCRIPVIAAGGIMDGAGMAAALALGAVAAQMGTAFILCPETDADEAYRKALAGPAAFHTRMTDLVSGRPARCLSNRFTSLSDSVGIPPVPDYPIAYDAGKTLNKAARNCGESGFGAYWAGQGAPLARAMPVGQLMDKLKEELHRARYLKT